MELAPGQEQETEQTISNFARVVMTAEGVEGVETHHDFLD